MLAYLPPPWTREHMELRLQLASDDRKVAQPDEHGTCAADARDGDGRSSSTSDVSEDRETEMEAEAEDIREANEAQEDSRDDDESWGEQGAGSAPGAMSVEMQQVSRVIPGVEGTAQVQPDQEAGSSAGKAAMGQPTSPSKTGWRALRGLNLRSTSRSCKGSLQCSAGSFLKHMMLEDIKPDATGRCHLILHGGSLLGTQQQSKLWGQPVVLYQFQQGFKVWPSSLHGPPVP